MENKNYVLLGEKSWHASVILAGSGETVVHEKPCLGVTAEKAMHKASKSVWVVKSEASRRALANVFMLPVRSLPN